MPAKTWPHRNNRCSHSFNSTFIGLCGNGVMEWRSAGVLEECNAASSNTSITPVLQHSVQYSPARMPALPGCSSKLLNRGSDSAVRLTQERQSRLLERWLLKTTSRLL